MKNLSKKWNKFKELTWSQKKLIFKVIPLIIIIKLGLVVLPFKNFKAIYQYLVSKKENTNYHVEQIVWSVKAIASTIPLGLNCLPQALTTKYFLTNNEYKIKIGVQFSPEKKFEAHAWIEKNGIFIIGDFPAFQYTPIWEWN